jgi:hypothetical protein
MEWFVARDHGAKAVARDRRDVEHRDSEPMQRQHPGSDDRPAPTHRIVRTPRRSSVGNSVASLAIMSANPCSNPPASIASQ